MPLSFDIKEHPFEISTSLQILLDKVANKLKHFFQLSIIHSERGSITVSCVMNLKI